MIIGVGDIVVLNKNLEPYEVNDANGNKIWVIDDFSHKLQTKNKKQTTFPIFGHNTGIFMEKVHVEVFDYRAKKGNGKLRKLMYRFYFGQNVFIEPKHVTVIMSTKEMV
jgi:hypothetical protein